MITAPRRRRRLDVGFTTLELMVVVAVVGVLVAAGLPVIGGAVDRFTLNNAARGLGADIRSTRWSAVAKNRTMILRFNCPAPNEYRLVEFTGNAAIDNAPDRCSEAAYPFPDPNPGAAPDADGPIIRLPRGVRFTRTADTQFDANGRLTSLLAPITIEVTNGREFRRVTIPASGRVVE